MASLPNSPPRIKVLLADGFSISAQLLAEALLCSRQFEVMAASSAHQALDLMSRVRCDISLISPNIAPDPINGVRFVREISVSHPEVNSVALLDSLDRKLVVEAFRAGALGVFCRSHSFEALCKCIRCVHAGEVWANSAAVEFLLDALVDPGPIEPPLLPNAHRLSRREEEISHLVAEGFSNRQISARLNLSEHTIKNYLFRVFEKLGVSTRVELTLYTLGRSKLPEKSPAYEPVLRAKDELVGNETRG